MDQQLLLDELRAVTTVTGKAAIIAQSVLDDLPKVVSEIALQCAFLPWFTQPLVAVLVGSKSDSDAVGQEIFESIRQLRFVEEIPWGWTFHSATRDGLLSLYAEREPSRIVETWRKVLPALLKDRENDESALAAFYGLIVTGKSKQASAHLDYLLNRYLRKEESNRLWSVFKTLEEAEALQFVSKMELTPKQWHAKGISQLQQGRISQALSDVSQAISLDPQDAGFLADRAVLNSLLGHNDNAFRDFDAALHIEPKNADIRNLRALLYMRKKEYDKALADLDFAIRLHPEKGIFYNNRAMIYKELQQYEEALKDHNWAIGLQPSEGDYYNNRAATYRAMGQIEWVMADHNRALELKEFYPVAFLSYVPRVDRHDGGRLSQFREILSEEVSITIGENFDIFHDRENFQWEQNWHERIEQSIDSSTFLIPIITPDYFNNEACRRELSLFLAREEDLNRSDLILPIYYITTDKLEKSEKRDTDPLAQAVAAHQWADWRELRFESFDPPSPVVRKAIAQLAAQIKDALERVEALPRLSDDVVSLLIRISESVGTDRRDAEENIAKLAFLYAGSRYGIAYGSIAVDCIIHEDGSATVIRQVELTAYANTEQLDTFLLLPEEPPADEWDINLALVEVQSTTKGKQVTLSQTAPKADRLTSILNITPPLTIGEKIGYRLKEPLPPQFYTMRLTESRLEEGEDNYDYFGWNINRPTEKFALRVHFPAEFGLPQDFQVQVRYASGSGLPASHFQLQEQLRSITPILRRGDNNEGYMLQLNVDYPMTGLIYILRWLPRVDDALFASLMNKPSQRQRSSGIAPKLYRRLRQGLINCGPFATHQELRTIFVDPRIFAWRDQLMRAETPISRVEAIIDFLYNQANSNQENGLVLFLRVLSERHKPGDACGDTLAALAAELEQNLTQRQA